MQRDPQGVVQVLDERLAVVAEKDHEPLDGAAAGQEYGPGVELEVLPEQAAQPVPPGGHAPNRREDDGVWLRDQGGNVRCPLVRAIPWRRREERPAEVDAAAHQHQYEQRSHDNTRSHGSATRGFAPPARLPVRVGANDDELVDGPQEQQLHRQRPDDVHDYVLDDALEKQ